MAALHPLHGQMNDDRRAGQARWGCGRHSSAHWQRNHIPQRFILPLTLGNCRAACAPSARRPAFQFLNAHLHVSRQAVRNALHRHLKSLLCVLMCWIKQCQQVRTKFWESSPIFRRAI